MTGRARISGQTRIQIIWHLLHDQPHLTCQEIWRHVTQHAAPCTATAVDKTLRDMLDHRYVTRVLVNARRGQRQFVYAAAGHEPPPDGRVTKIREAITASVKARKGGVSLRRPPVDPDDDEDDNWGGGGCARKTGTPADLPGIPSLAELLART